MLAQVTVADGLIAGDRDHRRQRDDDMTPGQRQPQSGEDDGGDQHRASACKQGQVEWVQRAQAYIR